MRDLVTGARSHTLQFRITADFAPSLTLNLMATVAASVVEKKIALANEVNGDLGNGWLKTHSATSGPYKLDAWKPNELVSFEANPGYHLGPPRPSEWLSATSPNRDRSGWCSRRATSTSRSA